MNLRTLVFSTCWLLLFSINLAAKQITIAAIVDDKVITTYDLEQRLKVFAASTNIKISPQNKPALLSQIRELLILEELKFLAAKEMSVSISAAEMAPTIADIAKGNNITPSQFEEHLHSQNLSYESVYRKIKAELLWQKLIVQRISAQIKISDIEVKEALKISQEAKKQVEVKYDILSFKFSDPTSKELAEELGEKFYQKISNNELKFSDIRHNKIATKDEIKWVDFNSLKQIYQKNIKDLSVNEISKPFISEKQVIILKLFARRESQLAQSQELENKIRHKLFLNKLENQASSFLRDIENSYYIERKQI